MTSPDENPFLAPDEADKGDIALALQAAGGSRASLEELVRRHQRWIYAIALRMMLNPSDAADIAQEALLRVVTRIGQFEGRSSFRTWAYRIVVHCFLDAKRGRLEQVITGFAQYGEELDRVPLQELPDVPSAQVGLLVEEAKLGCMLGMLLCLDREQRIALIMGEIFECSSQMAAEILDLTPAAYRKRLERARADLSMFMKEKCGLMNPANPCRCERKTRGFIEAGWVDPRNLKFTAERVQRVREDAPAMCRTLDELSEERMQWLFREHPVLDRVDMVSQMTKLLNDSDLRHAFHLEPN